MNFLAPFAFLFAATLPVVIVFYMLKRRRTVRLVSSTILWQKFLAETQANAPFQKLRNNWLLLLQLLLLALAVFALARPYFAATTQEPGLVVVILDGSASMQARDESPTRFEAARKEALKLVDGLKDTDQMIVVLSAGNTVVRQSPTAEKTTLRRALEECQPGDTPTRVEEAFKLAQTLSKNRSNVEVHFFSDGAIPAAENLTAIKLPVVYHQFGKRANNAGITAMDVRPHPEDPSQRVVFASVFNASTNAQTVSAELRFNGQFIDSKVLNLPAREAASTVFAAEQKQSGTYTLKLKADDDLAVDNEVSIISKMPRPVKVLLVSVGNRFMESAIRVLPNVEVSTASQLTAGGKGYDIVVLDRVTPVTQPEVNTLAWNIGNTNWFESWRTVENPVVVDWNANHPLMRFVTFDNVRVYQTLGVKAPKWGLVLVEAQQTPLLIAGEKGRQRLVWVGFDSLESEWPLRNSFIIFMANSMDWLNPQQTDASQFTLQAGTAFRQPLFATVDSATVTLPKGDKKEVKLGEQAKEFIWGETYRVGSYKVNHGTNEMAFTVNLMDPAESDITPRSQVPVGAAGSVTATNSIRANLEYWRWFVMAALGVLLFEWWYYHRRTV
ncbi:MAG TPA: VWA domain-containing protein [Verrucomicrobiae bacterium]